MQRVELNFDDIQPCPLCDQRCARENYSIDPWPGHPTYFTRLYCDFCEMGFLTQWNFIGGRWHNEATLEYSAAEPEKLERFRKDLRDARCAAA